MLQNGKHQILKLFLVNHVVVDVLVFVGMLVMLLVLMNAKHKVVRIEVQVIHKALLELGAQKLHALVHVLVNVKLFVIQNVNKDVAVVNINVVVILALLDVKEVVYLLVTMEQG